jgi:hypothetical protein
VDFLARLRSEADSVHITPAFAGNGVFGIEPNRLVLLGDKARDTGDDEVNEP